MEIKRLDHISVVDDLAAAIEFFSVLGMTIEGKATVQDPWVDRINGIDGLKADIVMMRTPDGNGRLELTKFRDPELVPIEPAIAPPSRPRSLVTAPCATQQLQKMQRFSPPVSSTKQGCLDVRYQRREGFR